MADTARERARERCETMAAAGTMAGWYGYTHAHIAAEFVRRHGGWLRFVARRGWFQWNGEAWERTAEILSPMVCAGLVLDEVVAEVASFRSIYPSEVKFILSRSVLGSVGTLGEILRLAAKDPRVRRRCGELNHERGHRGQV